MYTLKEIAYSENTDSGWLREQGHDQKFIAWIEANGYESYDGFDRWIHTKTRKLFSFESLRLKYAFEMSKISNSLTLYGNPEEKKTY